MILSIGQDILELVVSYLTLKDAGSLNSCCKQIKVNWCKVLVPLFEKDLLDFLKIGENDLPQLQQLWRSRFKKKKDDISIVISIMHRLLSDDCDGFLYDLRNHWWVWNTTDFVETSNNPYYNVHFHHYYTSTYYCYGLIFPRQIPIKYAWIVDQYAMNPRLCHTIHTAPSGDSVVKTSVRDIICFLITQPFVITHNILYPYPKNIIKHASNFHKFLGITLR